MLTFSAIVILDVSFDIGKWALGRYTGVPMWLSVVMIIGFSALLAVIIELIHRHRRAGERHYEQYLHHEVKVWVETGKKGEHWKESLCPQCAMFAQNCVIAGDIHRRSKEKDVVLVVWECPMFKKQG